MDLLAILPVEALLVGDHPWASQHQICKGLILGIRILNLPELEFPALESSHPYIMDESNGVILSQSHARIDNHLCSSLHFWIASFGRCQSQAQ